MMLVDIQRPVTESFISPLNLPFDFVQCARSYCLAHHWGQSAVPRVDQKQHKGLTS